MYHINSGIEEICIMDSIEAYTLGVVTVLGIIGIVLTYLVMRKRD